MRPANPKATGRFTVRIRMQRAAPHTGGRFVKTEESYFL